MSIDDQRAKYASVTAGARVFALILLAPPVAMAQNVDMVVNALLLAAVWTAGVFVEGLRRAPVMTALVVESTLVTFIACMTLETSPLLLVALVVPPFIGGLVRGRRGVLEVVVAEAVISVAVVIPNSHIENSQALAGQLFFWLMLGLGIGLMAAFLHGLRSDDEATTSYRDARRLLVEFRNLSGELETGLDPVTISEHLLVRTRSSLPLTGAVVYARAEHGFVPLVEGDVSDHGIDNAHVLQECFTSQAPVLDGPWVAFPLTTDAGVVAVVAGALLPTDRPATAHLRQQLGDLMRRLRPFALRLDTALLFAAVRSDATAEERSRLARELHDGVAQDLASFGYLIDDLADGATTIDQARRCDELRSELRRVVTELRRSLFVLRNAPDENTSLGQSVQAMASHLEARSGLIITVTLVEGVRRLRAEVEAELLRIAQEGITNAVKHSNGNRVEVVVHVSAPHATIVIRDNGRGLGGGREDSYGIRIMRERARRIGAVLDLHDRNDLSGTELCVRLGNRPGNEGPDLILEESAS